MATAPLYSEDLIVGNTIPCTSGTSCSKWDLNPHDHFWPTEFKSVLYTNFNIRAWTGERGPNVFLILPQSIYCFIYLQLPRELCSLVRRYLIIVLKIGLEPIRLSTPTPKIGVATVTPLEQFRASSKIRTYDNRVTKARLYQLSYRSNFACLSKLPDKFFGLMDRMPYRKIIISPWLEEDSNL